MNMGDVKTLFQNAAPNRLTRGAFVIMPFAFSGSVALSEYDDSPLPDAAANGSGDEIMLLLFSDAGERREKRGSKRSVRPRTSGVSSYRPRSSPSHGKPGLNRRIPAVMRVITKTDCTDAWAAVMRCSGHPRGSNRERGGQASGLPPRAQM